MNTPNMPVYRDDKMIGRYYTNFTIQHGLSNLTQIFIKEGVNFIEEQVGMKSVEVMLVKINL